MKVILEQSALIKTLGHIHRVVERRTTIPILSNVLLRTTNAGLQLKATDLDVEITETVAADVSRPGSTTLPAHTLHEIVRKFAEGAQVSLETDDEDSKLILRSGRSRFTLQTLPETDFPNLAAGDMTHKFTIVAGDLKRLLDKTQFAISSEETRYYLNGVYMHVTNHDGKSVLRAVATDGHRLARIDTLAPAHAEGMPGIIIPRKTTGEIQKLIEDPEEQITVELSSTKIRFTIGNVILTSKLIEGNFPDYARVIPSFNDQILTIDRRDFSDAVDRVSTISSERGRSVKLTITDGRIVLSVVSHESGSAVEEVEANYDSSPLEIGFNARYLVEITNQLDSAEATFKFNDSGSPAVVVDNNDSSCVFVLMPMRC